MRVKSLAISCRLQVGHQLLALVGEGPDVDVGAIAIFFDQLHGDIAEVVHAVWDIEHQHAAAEVQSLIVLAESENVGGLVLCVPVATDALKDGGAIVEGMGHHTHTGILQGHHLASEKGELGLGRATVGSRGVGHFNCPWARFRGRLYWKSQICYNSGQ